MKLQQALNTLLSVLVASTLAERWDASLGTGKEQIAQIELALTLVIGGVLSFALEALRAVALDLLPARFTRIARLLGNGHTQAQ